MRRFSIPVLVTVLVGALAGLTGSEIIQPTGPAAAAAVDDGTTEQTAAPSCWWVKQAAPASTSGIYWIQTPDLIAPQQFFCDMETDGGGWVLVGRGREDWSFETGGQRSPADVRDHPDGVSAFPAAALSGEIIDGLLAHRPVHDLVDGVRIRRARNIAGSDWQEIRMRHRDTKRWAWGFGGAMPLSSIAVDGTDYIGSNTADTSLNFHHQTVNGLRGFNDHRRVVTKLWSTTGWLVGFTYGAGIGGTTAPDSYLFRAGSSTQHNAMPFAQVWLRPRLSPSDVRYGPIPATGTAAIARRPLLESTPAQLPWGVSGLGPHQYWSTRDHDVAVWAITQIGDTMYVGGMFTEVVHGPGSTPVQQPYLAAFDRASGEWVPAFRPDVEGPVYDLEVSADGQLLVAGEFRGIDGVPGTQGLASVDPLTGEADPTWLADVGFANGTRPRVQALDVEGDWVYAAGDFGRVRRDGQSDLHTFNLARFDATTGEADHRWLPATDGSVLDITAASDRVWLAGHFGSVNQTPETRVFTAIDTVSGAVVPGTEPYQPSSLPQDYQQAVLDVGDQVYVGGSEHIVQRLDRTTHRLGYGNITMPGGDFQALAEIDGVVYATCHCNQWVYDGATVWHWPDWFVGTHRVRYTVALDAATGRPIPEFYPRWEMSSYFEGPWTAYEDSRGCGWFGGDPVRGAWTGSGYGWVAGFARFCPRDVTPPAVPALFQASLVDDVVELSWSAVSDGAYEILRDGRVLTTTAATSLSDADGADATYAVRAIDAAGNRSASTPPQTPEPAAGDPTVVIDAEHVWSYLADGTAPPADWDTVADLGSWPTGPAELGWGDGDEQTVIPSGALVQWFATDVDATDVVGRGAVTMLVRRDDGVRVLLDGLEVFRNNLPAGNVDGATWAPEPVWGDAERDWLPVLLPRPLFGGASQRVAASLHQAWAGSPDGSFALRLLATADSGDVTPPAAVAGTATSSDSRTTEVTWSAATDDVAVGWIIVSGRTSPSATYEPLALLPGSATTWMHRHDGEPWSYRIDVIDTNSNVTTTTVAGAPDPMLIRHGDEWRWRYDGSAVPGSWTTPGFDDSGWSVGPGKLGFGDPGMATTVRTGPAPHPVTAYFRTTFDIDDPTSVASLHLEILRDDSVAVYVNGEEVGRDNLPTGPLSGTTYATAGVYGSDELVPLSMTVPAGFLVAGENVVAAEVHQQWDGSPDLAFSLSARADPA